MLTANRLRKLLSYDPATGKFRWRIGVRAGRLAGNIRGREGYYQIGVDRKLYQASRLAWLYMTGKWPKLQIDYVNRNRSDTCWANLRLVTPAQKRVSAHTTSKLGVKGVWITPGGKYAARIKVAGKITYLGSFDTTKEAGAAYAKAAKRAYGKFARER